MKLLALATATTLSLSGAAAANEVADVYKSHCKSCHGAEGKADTKIGKKEKIDDFSSPKWQSEHSDADIRKVIAEGSTQNSKMKPYKDKLSATELDGLVAYIRTLKH